MSAVVTVLHVIVCFFLIAVVLLQRGKGAQIGAVVGGGAGATLFGSRGAGNLLTKLTTISAAIFMITSLSLSYFGMAGLGSERLFQEGVEQPAKPEEGSLFEEVAPPAEPAAPAAEAAPPAEPAPAPAPDNG